MLLTHRQISQETDTGVLYFHLFKNFSEFVVIHSKRLKYSQWSKSSYFSGFPWLSPWSNKCWHLSICLSVFSKPSLYIWEFSVHVLLKPNLKDVEHNFTSMQIEHKCRGVWTFFGIDLFQSLWPLLSFPNLLAYWVQHFNSIIF